MVLAPPLHVGRPQAIVPHPDWRGLKQRLIRALLPSQAQEREVYGSHNWNAGWPVAAEADMTLQRPEARCVFSWSSCP